VERIDNLGVLLRIKHHNPNFGGLRGVSLTQKGLATMIMAFSWLLLLLLRGSSVQLDPDVGPPCPIIAPSASAAVPLRFS